MKTAHCNWSQPDTQIFFNRKEKVSQGSQRTHPTAQGLLQSTKTLLYSSEI